MAMAEQGEKTKKRVAVATLGCKVNQYESAAFLSELAESEQVEIVPFSDPAEVYVVNTCAVTAKAGAQSRQLVRRAARRRKARVVVTGCYAQIAPQNIFELSGGPLCIVGNSFKGKVSEAVLAPRSCDLEMYLGDMAACRDVAPLTVTRYGQRTRAVLKVQDGCSQGCSYCIVPISRGPSRSVDPERVVEQAEIYAGRGYREVVLTGIHLGHYGQDISPPLSLAALIRRLLALKLPLRYRVSSLEPSEISRELLDLMAGEDALLPHLHIPLQSGDDRILAAMGRPYGAADFASVIELCAKVLPAAAIGVDVLVGFPGEDEAAFANTRQLLSRLPVSYLHVFPYSPRPGTRAATMAGQVPGAVKSRRAAQLRKLDRQKREHFYRAHLGTVRPVLVEGGGVPGGDKSGDQESAGSLGGFTDNYIPVRLPPGTGEVNELIMVRLDELAQERVLAGPVDSSSIMEGGAGRQGSDERGVHPVPEGEAG